MAAMRSCAAAAGKVFDMLECKRVYDAVKKIILDYVQNFEEYELKIFLISITFSLISSQVSEWICISVEDIRTDNLLHVCFTLTMSNSEITVL